MSESPDLPNKSKLEDPEFMDRLGDTLATKVEEFLDDPRWGKNFGQGGILPGSSRDVYADTKTVVDKIRRRERLDGLRLPADVFITIQMTCYHDFGLTVKESYRVLGIYFSSIFSKHEEN